MSAASTDEVLGDERRSPDERQSQAGARLTATLLHAWDHAPAWRSRMSSVGLDRADLGSPAALVGLDVLPKGELPAIQRNDPPFGGLATRPPGDFARIFMSPGPIFDPQLGDQDIGGFARGLRLAGFTSDDLVLNTFSYHLTPAGHAFESGALALGASVIPAGFGNTEQQAELVQMLPVTAYIGTPSFLALLVERASWRFRRACVSGEKMTEGERANLESRGGSVAQVYGTADLGYLAGECTARAGLHLTEDAHLEVLDLSGAPVDDGVAGEIVVSTYSADYPMLRLGTGDLTRVLSREPCSCGRTSPRIAGVVGRVGAGIKVRGMFVYEHDVHEASLQSGLAVYQLAVQRSDGQDQLILRITEDLDQATAARVVSAFRDRIKLTVEPIVVVSIDEAAAIVTDERDIWGV